MVMRLPMGGATDFKVGVKKMCTHFSKCGGTSKQILDPGAAVTKSPPPVIFCQVGVSHIYVTESQPPVIFMPT